MSRRSGELGPAIAARINAIRSARGLSVRELARLSHCSASTVAKVLTGAHRNASVGLLVDIARALEVRPGWLILGEGKGPS